MDKAPEHSAAPVPSLRAAPRSARGAAARLSIVVPAFNERDNLRPFVVALGCGPGAGKRRLDPADRR